MKPHSRKPSRHKRRRTPPGAAPGTLIPDPNALNSEMEVLCYGPDSEKVTQHRGIDLDSLVQVTKKASIHWINVTGLRNTELIQQLGEHYQLHPLAMEDIINVNQRPKVEVYDSHLFIVTRMPLNDSPGIVESPKTLNPATPKNDPSASTEPGHLGTEQVAIFLGENYVITFQEQSGDVFEPVRKRLRARHGRIRTRGADYLAYALLDAAIDSFFPILEHYGEQVEEMERIVIQEPKQGHIANIHELKRNLLTARRTVWPQREMLNALIRDESSFIQAETRIFLRDCYDHTIQLLDMLETYREIASGLVDLQLTSISNRMNDIMKVLTIIATIFIPLTFIAGIYGMNFDPESSPWNMPELSWRYGYPAALASMAAIAAALLFWFRRKGWIGNRN